jgi:hypothetical protein
MSVKLPATPKFGEDFKKTLNAKMRAAFSIRCAIHDQTAPTENGRIVACCDDLDRRLRSELQKI